MAAAHDDKVVGLGFHMPRNSTDCPQTFFLATDHWPPATLLFALQLNRRTTHNVIATVDMQRLACHTARQIAQ